MRPGSTAFGDQFTARNFSKAAETPGQSSETGHFSRRQLTHSVCSLQRGAKCEGGIPDRAANEQDGISKASHLPSLAVHHEMPSAARDRPGIHVK